MISIAQGNGKAELISPEEVSALILGKMKEIAEKYIG
jgi:molecular chaperone DnaK (HSP70)